MSEYEEARATCAAAMSAYKIALAEMKVCEQKVVEARERCHALYATFEDARRVYLRVAHRAGGLCAAMIRVGTTWSGHEEMCKSKAKPDSPFCGRHKNSRLPVSA